MGISSTPAKRQYKIFRFQVPVRTDEFRRLLKQKIPARQKPVLRTVIEDSKEITKPTKISLGAVFENVRPEADYIIGRFRYEDIFLHPVNLSGEIDYRPLVFSVDFAYIEYDAKEQFLLTFDRAIRYPALIETLNAMLGNNIPTLRPAKIRGMMIYLFRKNNPSTLKKDKAPVSTIQGWNHVMADGTDVERPKEYQQIFDTDPEIDRDVVQLYLHKDAAMISISKDGVVTDCSGMDRVDFIPFLRRRFFPVFVEEPRFVETSASGLA